VSREDFEDAAPHSDLKLGGIPGRDALGLRVIVFDDPLCTEIRSSVVDVRVKRWTDHLSGTSPEIDDGHDLVIAVIIESEGFPLKGVNPVDDDVISGSYFGHC
jgi:hypothetical protein